METEPRKPTALVVDGQPLFCEGLTNMLAVERGADCREAHSREEALESIARNTPDIVLLDIGVVDGGGLDLIRRLRKEYPKMKILVLTMRDESFYAERCFRVGADGFVSKSQPPESIRDAYDHVMEGSTYISDEAATRLISRVVRSQKPAGGVSLLTDREVTVLELIGAGLPARQIAQRLRISPKTVDSHREHIKAKLELKNGAALTRFAVEWVSEQGPA